MKQSVTIQNTGHSLPSPVRARWCASFLCRLRGFMFRRQIGPQEGLLFVYPRDSRVDTSIHMLFVFTDLAVFWIDSGRRVVDKVLARPWRPAYAPRQAARFILEVHPDRLAEFQVGDTVEFIDA